MTREFRFLSPYLPLDTRSTWLKGNHHGHSTLSDGVDTPATNIGAYEAAGYDYFALSEHDRFCDPADYQDSTSMILLPAVEVTSSAGQTLMYLGAGADLPAKGGLSLPEVKRFVEARHGLFIVDHPNWLYQPGRLHAPVDDLLGIPDIAAIEIYTGVIERLAGEPHSLDVWDRLLSARMRVFGHATDDQHGAVDHFLGWNLVQWPDGTWPDAAGILAAMATGRFVASTGVTVSHIGCAPDGQSISVESEARLVRWIIAGGVVAEVTESGSGSLAIAQLTELERIAWNPLKDPGEAIYVRLELVGDAGAKAWSQPFFVVAGATS